MERRSRIFLLSMVGVCAIVTLALVSASRASPASPSHHLRGPVNALVDVTLYGDIDDARSVAALREVLLLADTFPLDLRLEYRHAPRSTLPFADSRSAAALECASRFGKFWTVLRRVIARADNANAFDIQGVVGDDANRWNSCLSDPSIRTTVASDRADANARGIHEAPALLIDGQRYDGVIRFDVLRSIITERIAGQNTAAYVPVLTADDLWERLNEGAQLVILDVRTPQEYTAYHLKDARSLPFVSDPFDIKTLTRATEQFVGRILVVVDDGSAGQQTIAASLQALGHSVLRFEGMEAAGRIPSLLAS